MTTDIVDPNLASSGYKEPSWSGLCSTDDYSLDVLKDGVIIENIKLSEKPYHIIGRFKSCDLIFEHPSLSRFHSVLQYCAMDNSERKEMGWYIMDLESTHGTIVNKNKINPLTYTRIRSGYVLKFGVSSRLYIVNGPEEDKDPLSKHTWTELNELKDKAKLNELIQKANSKDGVCMWGMDNDPEDDESCYNNGEAVQKYPHEKLYKDDAKKVIKWFFDREGVEEGPLYSFTNSGFNKSCCVLELPVYGENGHRIIVEVSGSDKKKDMVERCALQACYVLDEMNELYKTGTSAVVPRKDHDYYQSKDYYSSEEDEFYDRTGDLQQKRRQRMRRFGVMQDGDEVAVQTPVQAKDVDSAIVKLQRLEAINIEIVGIEMQLEEAKKAMETDNDASEMDEIEKYLEAINNGTLNRQARLKLKARIFELQREENVLRRQLKLSIPVTAEMRKTLFGAGRSSEPVPETVADEKKPAAKSISVKPQRSNDKLAAIRRPIEIESDEEFDEEEIREEKEPVKDHIGDKRPSPMAAAAAVEDEEIVKKKVMKVSLEEDASDWLPPQGQSGDGRTSLNDRLGY